MGRVDSNSRNSRDVQSSSVLSRAWGYWISIRGVSDSLDSLSCTSLPGESIYSPSG